MKKNKKIILAKILLLLILFIIIFGQFVYADSTIEYMNWVSYKSSWLLPTIGLVIYFVVTSSYETLSKKNKLTIEDTNNKFKKVKFQIITFIIFLIVSILANITIFSLNKYLSKDLYYSKDNYKHIFLLEFKFNGPNLSQVGLTEDPLIITNYQDYNEITDNIEEYIVLDDDDKYDESFFKNSSLIMVPFDKITTYDYTNSYSLTDVTEYSTNVTIIFDKYTYYSSGNFSNSASIYCIPISKNITSFNIEYTSIEMKIEKYLDVLENLVHLAYLILIATIFIILDKILDKKQKRIRKKL